MCACISLSLYIYIYRNMCVCCSFQSNSHGFSAKRWNSPAQSAKAGEIGNSQKDQHFLFFCSIYFYMPAWSTGHSCGLTSASGPTAPPPAGARWSPVRRRVPRQILGGTTESSPIPLPGANTDLPGDGRHGMNARVSPQPQVLGWDPAKAAPHQAPLVASCPPGGHPEPPRILHMVAVVSPSWGHGLQPQDKHMVK